jgi:hypothetical protein
MQLYDAIAQEAIDELTLSARTRDTFTVVYGVAGSGFDVVCMMMRDCRGAIDWQHHRKMAETTNELGVSVSIEMRQQVVAPCWYLGEIGMNDDHPDKLQAARDFLLVGTPTLLCMHASDPIRRLAALWRDKGIDPPQKIIGKVALVEVRRSAQGRETYVMPKLLSGQIVCSELRKI